MGDEFYPNNLDMTKVRESISRNSLRQDFKEDSWNPNDKVGKVRVEEYGYGGVMCFHNENIRKYASSSKYQENFVSFLEENDAFFIANGVEEYIIHTDFYYSGPQCNLEVMNLDALRRLKKLNGNITFPISVYKMKKEEINELLIF